MRLPQYDFIQLAFDEVTPISRSSHEFDMLTQVNLDFFFVFFHCQFSYQFIYCNGFFIYII
jgi:hypothetical protein